MKKRAVLVLILALVVGVLAGCGSSSATVDEKASTKKETKTEEKKDMTNLAIGTVIDLDGAKVSVDAFTDGPKDYSGTATKKATVTYKNESDKSISFNSYDWKSEDSSGVRKDVGIFMFENQPETLDSGDLAPGGTVTGDLYFEDTGITKIVYVPSFWSNDEELIFWNVAQ